MVEASIWTSRNMFGWPTTTTKIARSPPEVASVAELSSFAHHVRRTDGNVGRTRATARCIPLHYHFRRVLPHPPSPWTSIAVPPLAAFARHLRGVAPSSSSTSMACELVRLTVVPRGVRSATCGRSGRRGSSVWVWRSGSMRPGKHRARCWCRVRCSHTIIARSCATIAINVDGCTGSSGSALTIAMTTHAWRCFRRRPRCCGCSSAITNFGQTESTRCASVRYSPAACGCPAALFVLQALVAAGQP